MHPEIFGLIKSYGLMLAISFALGMVLSVRRGRPHGLSSETILDLVFGVMISSIVGVRAWFVLTHLDRWSPWYEAFFIWDGGMTLYGGILLATATVWWMTRRRGIPFLVIADIFAPGVILGIGITRIGCLLAGCCFGKPTDCACGLTFPPGAPASLHFGGVPVHPTQLYASAAGFLIFGFLLLLERRFRFRGAVFSFFLVLYGIARIVEDAFRYYESTQVVWGLSTNQWVSLALIAWGSVLAVVLSRRDRGRTGDV